MSGRGMKKWAPYKALVEQTDALRDLERNKEPRERPILSPDQEEEINEILVNYHGQYVKATYWKNHKIYEFCGIISKIDVVNRQLIFQENKKVLLSELCGLENL